VDAAVRAAITAQPQWNAFGRAGRARLLHRIADLLEARMDEFALAEVSDQGKTFQQARHFEMPRSVRNLRFFADLVVSDGFIRGSIMTQVEAPTLNGEYKIIAESVAQREPVGVAGIIVPWNLPLYLLTWKIAPALAMGNTVVAKPSELTSLTAFMLAELVQEAQLLPGVLNIVFGRGPSAGEALVSHPDVTAIAFTGGTLTGRRIASLAGSFGKKVSLELGGKNPSIVFADCPDLFDAVKTNVRAAFSNQGEICLCCSRIYVQQAIYDDFVRQFAKETETIVRKGETIGALISRQHLEKVRGYVEEARATGASILECEIEKSSDGYYMNPTIICGLSDKSRLWKEEIFGPVVCIKPFSGEEKESIMLANDTEYGLAASIWTRDMAKAQRLARQIKAGTIWINCWMVRDLAAPFGGMKASGHGREGGIYSLDFFSEFKTITSLNT